MAPIFPTILSSVGKRRYFHFKEIIRGPRQRTKITDAFQELFKNYNSPSKIKIVLNFGIFTKLSLRDFLLFSSLCSCCWLDGYAHSSLRRSFPMEDDDYLLGPKVKSE